MKSVRKESMAGLEELTGIDRRTIKQRIRTLTPEKGTKNAHIFWTGEALPLIYGRGEDETYDTDAERARLIHHQANTPGRKDISLAHHRALPAATDQGRNTAGQSCPC